MSVSRLPLLLAVLVVGAMLVPGTASAQGQLNVTFRFLPDLTAPPLTPVVRAFLPGSFNDWGPNTNGVIAPTAPSLMTFDAALNEYRYTRSLLIDSTYTYKVHYHRNASGTTYTWITDPLNPLTSGPNSDSVIEVSDPMLFQLAREENAAGDVFAVSAGLFGTQAVTALSFTVNGTVRDGLPFYSATSGIFRFELPAPVSSAQFELTATDALGRTVSESVGFPPPVVVDAPVPAGVRDGITYSVADPTKATLVLLAPNKSFVHFIGDPTDWEVDNAFLLRRDTAGPFGTRWWIELTGLTPGEEVRFQYLVDGEIRISDPYAEKVLDPSEDGFITEVTYPGLIDYPTGQTTQLVSVMQPGRAPYPWTATNYVRPDPEKLVIYEMIVRDFVAAHDFATVEDTLDYLQNMGVTALELMPVSEFDGNINWGYGPNHYFAVDKYYGPAETLKRLIDACHARGMAVLLDVVYNHQTGQAPFVRLYNEGEFGQPTPDNPWVNPTARHPFNVFNDNNHESAATKAWLDRANEYWLTEFRVDGFRYDLSKGFTQLCASGVPCTDANFSQYNQARINILTRMADALWTVDPDAYVILEHFADASEERVLANHGRAQGRPGMTLWNNMNRAYSQSAMGFLNDGSNSSDLRRSWPINNAYPLTGQVTYMESHDEQWLMFRNRQYGASSGTYNIRDLNTALGRQQLVGAFFLAVPGPRMIWQFGELGYGYGNAGEQCLRNDGSPECPASAPGRTDPKPIRWDYFTVPERRALYDTYRAMLFLRNRYDVFTSPQTNVTQQVGQNQPDRWIRLQKSGLDVVVVGNFGLTERTQNPPLQPGTWYEYFSGETLVVGAANPPITLAPGAFRLYTNQELVAVANEPDAPEAPTAFRLDAAYPNPFNPVTTLRFALPDAGRARLDVFDVLGRRVATLVDGALVAGEHTARLDGASLPSGVYVVRLTAGGHTATQRVTLVK